MKKILILSLIIVAFIAACCPNANAQNSQSVNPNEKITINASELTPEQLIKIKTDAANVELQKKLDTYGKWVGVGGEVGNAVKESLNAVVDVADKFGKTDVGKFTMIMVAWKIVGHDILRILLGILFFFTLCYFIFKIHRRTLTSRKIIIENPGWFKYPKKYQIITPIADGDDAIWLTVVLWIVFLVGIWITYSIMF